VSVYGGVTRSQAKQRLPFPNFGDPWV